MKQAETPGQFSLRDRAEENRHVIALSGELDIASAPVLQSKVVELCTDGARSVVVDLSELTFIDSTGLRTIMGARSLCDERSCDFSLVPGGRSIQRLFVLTGLSEHLPFVDDPLQAQSADGEGDGDGDGRMGSPEMLTLPERPSL
jgi:anti-anti-sigma factor